MGGDTLPGMASSFPTMASLLAFEAAARHLSLTRAAIELNITQSAVSQRIRTLESLLLAALFVREGNRIRLTEAAQAYLPAARAAISEIQTATDQAIDRQRGDLLTIACLGTFAIKCLIPAIGDFRRHHPGIALRIRTLLPHQPAGRHEYDLAIQYGAGDWPGMVSTRIGEEELFPVCSPALLNEGGLRGPRELARQTIIRTTSPFIPRDDWPLWLEAAGVPGLEFADELSCDLLYPSFQAAIEGLGVAMGRSAVVRADLEAGRLVAPFPVRLASPFSYYLLAPDDRTRLAKVGVFREWLMAYFQS